MSSRHLPLDRRRPSFMLLARNVMAVGKVANFIATQNGRRLVLDTQATVCIIIYNISSVSVDPRRMGKSSFADLHHGSLQTNCFTGKVCSVIHDGFLRP